MDMTQIYLHVENLVETISENANKIDYVEIASKYLNAANILKHFKKDETNCWKQMSTDCLSFLYSLLSIGLSLYWYIFITLLISATVGRRLKLTSIYVVVLGFLFRAVEAKIEKEKCKQKIRLKSIFVTDEDTDDEISCFLGDLQQSVNNSKFVQETSKAKLKRTLSEGDDPRQNSVISRKFESNCEKPNSLDDFKDDCLENSMDHDDKFCPTRNVTETDNEVNEADLEMNKTQSIVNANGIINDNLGEKRGCVSHGIEEAHFKLDTPMVFISDGLRAILDDCVSSSFTPEQLKTWNLLTRTIRHRQGLRSKTLTVFYVCGFLVRYVFMMPMRVLVLVLSLANLTVSAFIVGLLPEGNFKRWANSYVVSWGFDFVAGSLSVVARFHNKECRPAGGIAVANHTSPIDGMILATDNCYDIVGQKTKGLLGMFMSALSKSSSHIWFDRGAARDRQTTIELLNEHARHKELPPILMFPEGVCVNNTAVLEFRKGSFEVDCDIHPIAIRFDPVYGDAFWFKGGFASYCFSMMTSWAIVCDVYYLPSMRRKDGESASVFANRVRSVIAKAAGLTELEWGSVVKMYSFNADKWHALKAEKKMAQQYKFARSISHDKLHSLNST